MLHKIVETKREEVERLKRETTAGALLRQIETAPPVRGFLHALVTSARPVSVIAEVKKASPSKGLIRPDFDPLAIARAYHSAGVEAISVLTDETYFQGSLRYLEQIRSTVDTPLLRKDFLIDELQVLQARASGADCILLIVAILDGPRLHHLGQVAASLGMDTLIEVHDPHELEVVFRHTTPTLIGINNRNLRTFETKLSTTPELMRLLPADVPVVSESGIFTPDDISCVREAGARAVLVGEHFMRQENIQQAVVDLVGERMPTAPGKMA